MSEPRAAEDQNLWLDLPEAERDEIRAAMQVRRVSRGEVLIEEGAQSETLFIVNFGRFEVRTSAGNVAAEIGAGQLIGEMGFFSGGNRTATVVAARDSEVHAIDRVAFEALTLRHPSVQRAVTRALAKRLSRLSRIVSTIVSNSSERPHVILVVPAGSDDIPAAFIEAFCRSMSSRMQVRFVTSADVSAQFGGLPVNTFAIANWLADMERGHQLVICVADSTLTSWSEVALRSSDHVLLVGQTSPEVINEVEARALELYPSSHRRLVRLHGRRTGTTDGTAPWLKRRDVFMVHHVSLEDDADVRSLSRFLSGNAIGFVAGGGGAYGPAHIGIFKAFRESGIEFDIHGGSSVGSAMAASFSLLIEPDVVKTDMQEMFVRRGALQRLTIPRYGLLDHTVFDAELRQRYGIGDIEDAWKPYFAVATDLSTYSMHVIRRGPIWESIRASCAIPGVLPPFFDAEGRMLVDGGIVDNVPMAVMSTLKAGPNLVIDLRPPTHHFFRVDYAAIPGRLAVIRNMLNFLPGKKRMPNCPDPINVILRGLFSNIKETPPVEKVTDLVLRPPAFPGSSFMNWRRNAEVLEASYEWGLRTIEALLAEGDPAMTAMQRLSRDLA